VSKMNILIIKLSSIGDVVHTLPSLAALRKSYPESHITWVVEEASANIIEGNPHVNQVIVMRRKRWMRNISKLHHIPETLKEIVSFIRYLRDRRYDIVIDFMSLIRSSIIVFLSGGVRKIGYNSMQELSGLFVREKIYEDMRKHAVERYFDFVRYLGVDMETREFPIVMTNEDEQRVMEHLKTHGIDEKDSFVAVSPMSFAGETRLWENKNFADLCDRIINELKTKVIFTGERSDGLLEDIQSMMRMKSVNLGGQTTLRELACLYNKAAVLITPDSGPMHIAAAVGTPVIALFGPSDPQRTGPYGTGHTVIRRDLPCSPCFLKKCKTRHCMREITVEDVFQAVRNKLGEIAATNGIKRGEIKRNGGVDWEG
jgi:heptosyltransferase-1